MILRNYIYYIFFICSCFSWGQSDCIQSVITCGNTNFSNLPVNGAGNFQEISGQNSCGTEEFDSVWIKVTIKTAGTLAFVITPQSTGLVVDYDFFVFDGNDGCNALPPALRCSTTNPLLAGLNYNITGLNATSQDETEGPGSDGDGFVKQIQVGPNEVYYVLVNRAIGSGNFSLDWTGTATFDVPPIVNTNNTPTFLNLNLCQENANTGVDITQNSALAIGSQLNITVRYFTSYGDALANVNFIQNPTDFHFTTNPQTLYIRLENSISGCSAIDSFQLNVTNLNLPNLQDLSDCDSNGNGFFTFNFNSYATALSSNGTNVVTFLQGISSITPLPLLYTNAVAYQEETIWVKIENISTHCVVYKSFKIKVNVLPPIQTASIHQCDFEFNPDGITLFDLNQATALLTTGSPNYMVRYFLNDSDATNAIGSLNLNYTNIQNPQIITAQIIDTTTGCSSLSHVTLVASVVPTQTVPLTQCIDPAMGSSSFLFSDAGFETTGTLVTYHHSAQEALLEQNPIANQPYISSIPNEQIYVRIEDGANNCIGIHVIQLTFIEIPQAQIMSSGILCLNTPQIPVYLTCQMQTTGNYQYLWTPGNMTTPQIAVFQPGSYSVLLTNIITGCQNSVNLTIGASEIPEIFEIDTDDLVDSNTISLVVNGQGLYSYGLDDSPLQDVPVFVDVTPGEHTVKVWDQNGCGMVFQTITVLGIPKYFTPNGDGTHDFWQIIGIEPMVSKIASFEIYDRYGKSIARVNPLELGWNGLVNNQDAPSDDYWYVLHMLDGRIIKGHFTLKR